MVSCLLVSLLISLVFFNFPQDLILGMPDCGTHSKPDRVQVYSNSSKTIIYEIDSSSAIQTLVFDLSSITRISLISLSDKTESYDA